MSRDLLTQLRDYGRYHAERQLPIEGDEITLETQDIPIIPTEKGETTDMKPKHWGMLMVAAAVVVVVMVAGGVVIASNNSDDSDVSTEPAVDFDIVGWWEYTDRPTADSPAEQVRMEYDDDGTYALIAWPDVGADRGRYEFEDDVLTIHHDGGRGCEQLEGNPTGVYRLIFTGDDAATFEVVTDECSARENVLDGAQIARIPAG